MMLAFGQPRRKRGIRGNPTNIASGLWPGRQENSVSNPDERSGFFLLHSSERNGSGTHRDPHLVGRGRAFLRITAVIHPERLTTRLRRMLTL